MSAAKAIWTIFTVTVRHALRGRRVKWRVKSRHPYFSKDRTQL